jgi:CRISPR/Cas system-associated endoribonuclease Cas2
MYLNHVQNSVFEGELTVSYLKELIEKLRKIINK